MTAVFGVFAAIQFLLLFRFGRHLPEDGRYSPLSNRWPVNALPMVFFIHCSGPYLGLSTGGAVEMFSGRRTEGRVSNHYVITRPPYLFPYQDDVVYVEVTSDLYLNQLKASGQGLKLTNFRRFLTTREERLEPPFVIRVNGQRVAVVDGMSAREFEQKYGQPLNYLEYKFLIFRDVDSERPRKCRH